MEETKSPWKLSQLMSQNWMECASIKQHSREWAFSDCPDLALQWDGSGLGGYLKEVSL